MAIDYYAKEDGIAPPSLRRILSLTDRLSRRPVYFSHRLNRLCGTFDARQLIVMFKNLGMRTLLTTSGAATRSRRSPSPTSASRDNRKTHRHSVMSSLRSAQAVRYEMQMDEYMHFIKDVADRVHSARVVASVCLKGGKMAVFDVGGRDVCIIFRPKGAKTFDRYEMPPSREAMSIFADGRFLCTDYLVEGSGDDEDEDEEKEQVNASLSRRCEAVDVLRDFDVITEKRKSPRTMSASKTTTANIVRSAYGRSRFFPQHDRLAIVSMTDVSVSACVIDAKKLIAHLELDQGKRTIELIRLGASTSASSPCELSTALAPGVAVRITFDECHLSASPYRLCEYLLSGSDDGCVEVVDNSSSSSSSSKRDEHAHSQDVDRPASISRTRPLSSSLDADTATKIGMRKYAKKVWKLTKGMKSVKSTLASDAAKQKSSSMKRDACSPSEASTTTKGSPSDVDTTFNDALRDLISSYIGEEELAFDMSLVLEAESTSDGNVIVRVDESKRSGSGKATPVFRYRNAAYALDLFRHAIATARASSSRSS
eukprot:g1214.t1